MAGTTRFSTTVELGGRTATGFEVPPEVVDALGAGKRPAVTVTVGGHTYRSTVAVMGGRYLLPLSAENRTAAGLSAGDAADVELELDTAPRVVEVPADLAAALDAEPAARAAFDALSHSNQRRHTLSVEGAKTDATRARRVAKVVETLRAT
ncbi:YdeI/OmpD-associated family protein [Pseudonocardia sp. T1-2H]|uniref:YdeI/OmpD-associated family protein n=1 Tax=Pseudonocardia sp. T1-2H TaxID=3128899 RepID=UPI003100CB9D